MARRTPGSRFQTLRKLSEGDHTAMTLLYGKRFLRVYPDYGPAWCLVGCELIGQARYDEARQAVMTGLANCPEERRGYPLSLMGDLFRLAGNYDQAVIWYRRATEANPDKVTYATELGKVLARQGRLEEAEAVLRVAITCTEGGVEEAYQNLGEVLRAQERFDEAAGCFREVIRLEPKYKAAIVALRDVERCRKFLSKHASTKPDPAQ